jgi:hypothetical protein
VDLAARAADASGRPTPAVLGASRR